ncbi:MAG: hypothetical protein HZC19_02220 [Candidatus Omnitrophica bacterium]|nr:hypothetical protein [Candidatus Omnitrophota bacterium]
MAKKKKKATLKSSSNINPIEKKLTKKQKEEIDAAVKKIVSEYGEVLRLLGKPKD